MFWIVLLLSIIFGGILTYWARKVLAPDERFTLFVLGMLFPLILWVASSSVATASTAPRTSEVVASHILEELNEDEYIKAVYTDKGNSVCEESILFKYDECVRTERLKNITIHFNADEFRVEEHEKKFANKAMNFLLIELSPTTIELYVPGDKITGDYTITEESLRE